jgi:lipoprotein-anchoring transpeptidase ErfK/SrfK
MSAASATVPLTLAITPPAGTANLPISTEVGITLNGGQITDVTLTKVGNAEKIAGTMRDDGTSWIPAAPLAFSSAYNVAVTGRGTDGGQTVTRNTSFTTMGQPGEALTTGGIHPSTGETVGVAMPVVLDFNPPVPDAARAQVQKRLFVTTNPPQPGAWHWESGAQAWYRPPHYWQPGTTITVRAALGGLPMGDDRFGAGDQSTTVTVGPKVFIDIDNATKRLSVYTNEELVKAMPVSLGAEETPSSSGHMVVMSKEPTSQFFADLTVNNAMRLTAGGEYIHAAPWSVADQGVRNVSHGCTNLSEEDAAWVFGASHIGDPVIVRGTETVLTNGNGWTAWNVPWSEYIKGSALPVDGALAAVVSTPESVSAIAPPKAAPAPPSGAPDATPAPAPSR